MNIKKQMIIKKTLTVLTECSPTPNNISQSETFCCSSDPDKH